MKGIVAYKNGNYAIVLTKNGSFMKVKATKDMVIGQEIDSNRPSERAKRRRLVTRIASIAAAGLLTLGVGYAGYCYTLPYSYVHVDINPSVELTVNIYDRIIEVEALNHSGEGLIDASDLKNHRVDIAVKQLLNAAVEQGYLDSDDPQLAGKGIISGKGQTTEEADIVTGGQVPDKPVAAGKAQAADQGGSEPSTVQNAILLTVSSNSSKKSTALRENIEKAASKELEKEKVNSEILIGEASIEQRNDARRFGVTPGKLVLIEDALESEAEPVSQIKEFKRASINDLLKKASDKAEEKSKQEVERVKQEEQEAREKAKQEEQEAKEKAKQEEQEAREKAKQEEQEAKEKAKQEEQGAREKAEQEEQEAREKAEQEEQEAKEKAKQEVQKAKEKARQEVQKAKEKARQSNSGKSFWDDAAKKRQTQKDNNHSNSAKSGNGKKNNAEKLQKDLKDEREKLREDLLGQLKGRQDNNHENQYKINGRKDSLYKQNSNDRDKKREWGSWLNSSKKSNNSRR